MTLFLLSVLVAVATIAYVELSGDRQRTALLSRVTSLEGLLETKTKATYDAIHNLRGEIEAMKSTNVMLASKLKTAEELAYRANNQLAQKPVTSHPQKLLLEFTPQSSFSLVQSPKRVAQAGPSSEQKKTLQKVKKQLKRF